MLLAMIGKEDGRRLYEAELSEEGIHSAIAVLVSDSAPAFGLGSCRGRDREGARRHAWGSDCGPLPENQSLSSMINRMTYCGLYNEDGCHLYRAFCGD